MNFIELASDKEYKFSLNIKLIESVELVAGSVEIHTLNEKRFYRTRESYSEIMDKIHKAKRLEIASRIFGHIHQSFLGKFDGETIRRESLIMAEELIKQNENME